MIFVDILNNTRRPIIAKESYFGAAFFIHLQMTVSSTQFQKDIDDIAAISIVPTLLNVICQTTGMRFAAIARVTDEHWITCSVKDDISFGLLPGDELKLETTLCHEVKQLNKVIAIDHVLKDPEYHDHHTPALYGFQSYISVPITRRDGSFFGTLCAIDPRPNPVSSPAVVSMFALYADLISFHLNAVDELQLTQTKMLEDRAAYSQDKAAQQLFNDMLERKVAERTEQLNNQNRSLEKLNRELETLAFISSHDLQEPLRKIQTFSNVILEKEFHNLSDSGKHYFERMEVAASRMRSLIQDLISYSHAKIDGQMLEKITIDEVVREVEKDLKEELEERNATVVVVGGCDVHSIRFQFRQMIYNVFANSIKFARPGIPLQLMVTNKVAYGSELRKEFLIAGQKYCQVSISDNGIGFEQQYAEQIFELFEKLDPTDNKRGNGIGLAIVKKIVDNHQGFVIATGETNAGVTIDIFLPAIS